MAVAAITVRSLSASMPGTAGRRWQGDDPDAARIQREHCCEGHLDEDRGEPFAGRERCVTRDARASEHAGNEVRRDEGRRTGRSARRL